MKSNGRYKYTSLELASMTVLALSVCAALFMLSFCRQSNDEYVSADEFKPSVTVTPEKPVKEKAEKPKTQQPPATKSSAKEVKNEKHDVTTKPTAKPASKTKRKSSAKSAPKSSKKTSNKPSNKTPNKPEPKSPKSRDYRSELADD